MNLLSTDQYRSFIEHPMKRISVEASMPTYFWNYYDVIPDHHFDNYCGYASSDGRVCDVWEHPKGRIWHVLTDTSVKSEFMALVLDVIDQDVLGHRLLRLYEVGEFFTP